MWTKRAFALAGMAFLALTIGGCGKQVTRVDANSTTDLSGKWNDTDSRLVAEEMIGDCLSRPWYTNKYANKTPVPKIIVGTVSNKSHEHINVETFVNDMQRVLINSGKVDFVASKTERAELREEKADQMSGNAAEETVKAAGNEQGADLMLKGEINTIADQEGNKSVMFYQIDLQLIDLKTSVKLWIGDKKIKKYMTRSGATL
jgi:penicillin-binding protein activator